MANLQFLSDNLNPSSRRLWEKLCADCDPSMLLEISQADYTADEEEHLEAIHRLIKGPSDPEMEWHPKEVLQLFSFSEPDKENHSPGGKGKRGHIMRSFACAALIQAGAEGRTTLISFNHLVCQLVGSGIALGEGYLTLLPGFLFWAYQQPDMAKASDEANTEPFLIAGLILLVSYSENMKNRTELLKCLLKLFKPEKAFSGVYLGPYIPNWLGLIETCVTSKKVQSAIDLSPFVAAIQNSFKSQK